MRRRRRPTCLDALMNLIKFDLRRFVSCVCVYAHVTDDLISMCMYIQDTSTAPFIHHICRIVNERQKPKSDEHASPLSLSRALSLPNLIRENKQAITIATHLDILNVVKPKSKLLFTNCKKTKRESSRSSSLLDANHNTLARPKARAKCSILLTPATKMLKALHTRMLCKSSSHENALQK